MVKRQIVEGMSGWKHICKGGEICVSCRTPAKAGEERIWESSMDQDNLWCKNCAELVPANYVPKTKPDFARDKAGKISETVLSPYGKKQLAMLQGAKLHFTDMTLTVKGNELVDEHGKVFEKINNDRLVNKIIFKII
jgi:hypothetical protein